MSRKQKALFYTATSPLMKANAMRHRVRSRARQGDVKIHLGPGQKKYLDGWVNIDSNMFTGKCDIWANLIDGIPMPDNSAAAVYSHHVIEHLPDLTFHFGEMYRCLRPGGVFRVGGPNGDMAIQKYAEGDAGWFSNFPDKRESLGGRFENFIFCRQEHLTILTLSHLEEIATSVGFESIRQVTPCTETHYPELFDDAVLEMEYEDTPEAPHTLLIEGQKPAA